MSEKIAETVSEKLPDPKQALKALKQNVAPSAELARDIVSDKERVAETMRKQLQALQQSFTPAQLAQISALEAQAA